MAEVAFVAAWIGAPDHFATELLAPRVARRGSDVAQLKAGALRDRRLLLQFILRAQGVEAAPSLKQLDLLDVEDLLLALRAGAAAPKPGLEVAPAPASLEPQTPRKFLCLLRRPTRYSSPAPARAPPALARRAQLEPRLALLLQRDGALAALPEALVDWPAAAFQVFCAAAELAHGSAVDPSLTAFVCAELGVSLELAKHLRLVLPAWRASLAPQEGLTMRLPSLLLGATQWLGARELRRWRRLQLFQLLAALPAEDAEALQEPLCAETPDEPSLRELRALHTLRGWATPVDPLGVSIYGALVGATWSHLDVTASPGGLRSDALLHVMQACWPSLGVTTRAHAAHCVFAAFRDWTQTRDADSLESARRGLDDMALEMVEASQPEPAEASHLSATLGAVAAFCAAKLCDYHGNFLSCGAFHLQAVLDIRRGAAGVLEVGLSTEPLPLSCCIEASLGAAFERCVADVALANAESDDLPGVVARVAALLEAEQLHFLPALELEEPAALCIAVAKLQALLSGTLTTWLAGVGDLEEALPGLRAAEELVSLMQSVAIGGAAGDPPPPINVALLAEPLVASWVSRRVERLEWWSQRNAAAQEEADDQAVPDFVTVELVRGVYATVDAFFDLGVHQGGPARDLGMGLAGVLQRYAQRCEVAELPPPVPPPLTRYKREAVEVLRASAERGGSRDADALAARLDELMAAHGTLSFLLEELPRVEAMLQRRWASLQARPSTLQRGRGIRMAGLFADARSSCMAGRLRMLDQAGRAIGHLLCQDVYRFGVAERLNTTELHRWLARCLRTMDEDTWPDAGAALLNGVMFALRSVLLQGGPERFFVLDDVLVVKEDASCVMSLFVSMMALESAAVEESVSAVFKVLEAMEMDTFLLIGRYEAELLVSRRMESLCAAGVGRLGDACGAEELLCVLAHRADRTASKYLRTKGVGKAVSWAGVRSFRAVGWLVRPPRREALLSEPEDSSAMDLSWDDV